MSESGDNDNKDAVVFASTLVGQVNREDVSSMVQVQRDMLSRYEKTNEMLINFNLLSASRYEASVKDFQIHTQLLADMRQDLDSIFKRIRVLKQRLSKSYPEAFVACSSVIMMEDDDDFEDSHDSTAGTQPSHSASQKSPQPPVQIKVDAYKESFSSSDNIRSSQKKKRHSSGDKGAGTATSQHMSRKEREGGKQTSSHRHSTGSHKPPHAAHKSGQSHAGGQPKSKSSQ